MSITYVDRRPAGHEVELTEIFTIPSSAPYTIRLTEVPLKYINTIPSSGNVYTFKEQTTSDPTVFDPNPYKFITDYDRGVIYFNSIHADTSISITYKGRGSVLLADDLNSVIGGIYSNITTQQLTVTNQTSYNVEMGCSGVVEIDSSGGSWSNLSYVEAYDQQYASCIITGPITSTNTILLTGFNFDIPENAVINGVVLTIIGHGENVVSDGAIYLYNNGEIISDNKANSTVLDADDSVIIYGGDSDVWGATLTSEVVNDPTFGVSIRLEIPTTQYSVAYIDYVKIKLYYTLNYGMLPIYKHHHTVVDGGEYLPWSGLEYLGVDGDESNYAYYSTEGPNISSIILSNFKCNIPENATINEISLYAKGSGSMWVTYELFGGGGASGWLVCMLTSSSSLLFSRSEVITPTITPAMINSEEFYVKISLYSQNMGWWGGAISIYQMYLMVIYIVEDPTPKQIVKFIGLPSFSSNATALAAGLTVGCVYTNGVGGLSIVC